MRFRILVDGEPHDVEIDGAPPKLTVRVDGAAYRARVSGPADTCRVRIGSATHEVVVHGNRVSVDGRFHDIAAEAVTSGEPGVTGRDRAGAGTVFEVRPPMPGRVVRVRVVEGDRVKRGQTLVVLEAMKMQNEIPAPEDAIVRRLSVREGESIPGDRVIAVLESR